MSDHAYVASGSTANVIALTRAGQVEGQLDQGAIAFKGIPYGASTAGVGRWLPPRPPVAWGGVRQALEFGAMCPQLFGAPLAEETAILQCGPMSEDCLNLNVWTPALDDAARPVMVWFHGGVFSVGSGASTSNDGANLAARNDVVVVTVNHRLNFFGFLDVSSVGGPDYAASGNVGMLDCLAALEWVRDNIAGFGGDPGNVTIFGHSGGGMKVMHLLAMPGAKGLFHRAIAMSGFTLKANPASHSAAISESLIESLGLGEDALRTLQSLPAERLIERLEQRPDYMFILGPHVDGDILPSDPFAPGAPTLSADIPMMVGTTETEINFMPFTQLDAIDEATLHASLKEFTRLGDEDLTALIAAYRSEHPAHDNTYLYQVLASDWLLGADGIAAAERKAEQGGAPIWVYYWTRHTNAREGKLRAPHTVEIPYIFDTFHKKPPIVGTPGPADQVIADQMSRTWASFARTGNPNNDAIPHWPAYDLETRPVLVVGDSMAVESNPRPRSRAAMSEIRARVVR